MRSDGAGVVEPQEPREHEDAARETERGGQPPRLAPRGGRTKAPVIEKARELERPLDVLDRREPRLGRRQRKGIGRRHAPRGRRDPRPKRHASEARRRGRVRQDLARDGRGLRAARGLQQREPQPATALRARLPPRQDRRRARRPPRAEARDPTHPVDHSHCARETALSVPARLGLREQACQRLRHGQRGDDPSLRRRQQEPFQRRLVAARDVQGLEPQERRRPTGRGERARGSASELGLAFVEHQTHPVDQALDGRGLAGLGATAVRDEGRFPGLRSFVERHAVRFDADAEALGELFDHLVPGPAELERAVPRRRRLNLGLLERGRHDDAERKVAAPRDQRASLAKSLVDAQSHHLRPARRGGLAERVAQRRPCESQPARVRVPPRHARSQGALADLGQEWAVALQEVRGEAQVRRGRRHDPADAVAHLVSSLLRRRRQRRGVVRSDVAGEPELGAVPPRAVRRRELAQSLRDLVFPARCGASREGIGPERGEDAQEHQQELHGGEEDVNLTPRCFAVS